jgi:hypothetical protein
MNSAQVSRGDFEVELLRLYGFHIELAQHFCGDT